MPDNRGGVGSASTSSVRDPSAAYPYLCPICNIEPVETARKVWTLQGYLIIARYGTRIIVGCCDCVRRKVSLTLTTNLLLGWWSIPWGLGTPFVVIQNLTQLSRHPNRELLDEVMALVEAGTTASGAQALATIAAILAQGARHAGPGSTEWRRAIDVLVEFGDSTIDVSTADGLLRQHIGGAFDPQLLPIEDREVLLRMVAEIALADGALLDGEMYYLRELSDRLHLPVDLVDFYLSVIAEGMYSEAQSTASDDVARVLAILGLSPGASTGEIRAAYRSLMLRHHPDLVDLTEREEATRRAAEINYAYDMLVRRVQVA